jgi:uncharacterized protein YkwD
MAEGNTLGGARGSTGRLVLSLAAVLSLGLLAVVVTLLTTVNGGAQTLLSAPPLRAAVAAEPLAAHPASVPVAESSPVAQPAPPQPVSPSPQPTPASAPAPVQAPAAVSTVPVGPAVGSGDCGGPGTPPSALIAGILELTNGARAASGLGTLTWNPQLYCLASEWSTVQGNAGTFDHRDLNAALRSPAYGAYRALGENLLRGPNGLSAGQMHDAWMASPGHRANILQGQYTSIGIAIYVAPSGTVYATQNFGV